METSVTVYFEKILYISGQNVAATEYGTPERTFPFPIFIRKEIGTRKLERKSKQQRYNKSFNRHKMEWKLKQENQNGY